VHLVGFYYKNVNSLLYVSFIHFFQSALENQNVVCRDDCRLFSTGSLLQ